MRNDLEEDDGKVAKKGTSGHVAHSEEDWVFEAIIGEQVFVEENDSNVGRIP